MSNFKRLVEARIAKTGESWSTASRQVRAQAVVPASVAPALVPSELEALLAALKVSTTFGVATGRMPNVGASASLAVATQIARDRVQNPTWYAETGPISMAIARTQHDLLVANGAAERGEIQIIRSFHNDHGATFSARCDECKAWIWCGTNENEREDQCRCGATYRVVFDAEPDWTMNQDWLCADCGATQKLTEVAAGRNPWHLLNKWQVQCNLCHAKAGRPGGALVPEIRERRFAGVVNAHYVVVRPNLDKGETLEDAVAVLRREAYAWPDLVHAEIRVASIAGHPRLCAWTRLEIGDPWAFEWGKDFDTGEAGPAFLSDEEQAALRVRDLKHVENHQHREHFFGQGIE